MSLDDMIQYPDIQNLSIPRERLIRDTIDELRVAMPAQLIMSGQQNWEIWDELCKANAYLGNLDVTWVSSDMLSSEICTRLEEKNARIVFIRQPIIISGAPGYVFDEIICEMELLSLTKDMEQLQKPTVELMLPASHWHTVLRWGGRLVFSVDSDSNLAISSNIAKALDIEGLGLIKEVNPSFFSIKYNNSASANTSAKFIVPPFEYVVMRPVIRSDGSGSNVAKWFFGRGPAALPNTTGMLEQQPLMLGAFVMLPRNACLNIKIRMAARHHIDSKIPNFSSIVDTLQLLGKSVRDFIVGGFPLVEESLNGYDPKNNKEPLCEF